MHRVRPTELLNWTTQRKISAQTVAPSSPELRTAPIIWDGISVLVGVLTVGAFAPFHIWPLAIVCPAVLIFLWQHGTPRRALLRGFLFGAGEFLGGIYWIYIAVTSVGGGPVWLGALLYLALAFACALFPAIVGYLSRRLEPTLGFASMLFIPASWALFAWVRSFLFTGFPWLSLGFSQVASPLIGYAPIVGVYGVSFIVMLLAVLVTVLFATRSSSRRKFAVAIVGGLLFVGGTALTAVPWTMKSGQAFRVSLIQGDIQQTLKWKPSMLGKTVSRYISLSSKHWNSQLIVWPESAIPTWYQNARSMLRKFFIEARHHRTALAFGVPVYHPFASKGYNAMIGRSPAGVRTVYYKRHLVPFGEYFPVPGWIKSWLKAHALPYSSFTPGPYDQGPLQIGRWRAAIALCYEIAFGRLLLTDLPQAQFIINASDDGWFGHSIALAQQFQMAQFAAAETRRDVLVAADDGITGIIGPQGQVRSRLRPYRVGVLTGLVQPRSGATWYVDVGNQLLVAFASSLAMCVVLWRLALRYFNRGSRQTH